MFWDIQLMLHKYSSWNIQLRIINFVFFRSLIATRGGQFGKAPVWISSYSTIQGLPF